MLKAFHSSAAGAEAPSGRDAYRSAGSAAPPNIWKQVLRHPKSRGACARLRSLRLPVSFEQEVGDGERGEEHEAADFVHTCGKESVNDRDGNQHESDYRSP